MSDESKKKTTNDQRLEMEQDSLAEEMISMIRGLKISYSDIIKEEQPVLVESPSKISKAGDTNHFLQDMVSQILKKKVKFDLLFDSTTMSSIDFKRIIGGKRHLLTRV